MNNRTKYGILFVVILITALLVWLFQSDHSATPKGKIMHISSNWDEKYGWNSKDPYGLFIFHDILKDYVKHDSSLVVNSASMLDSLQKTNDPSTYLYVGQDFGLYDTEFDTLLKLVENGSDLIVVSNNVTSNVSERFSPALTYSFDYSQTVQVRSKNKDYSMVYLFQNDTLAYPWKVFNQADDLKNSDDVLSSISGEPNFIRFTLGKGQILFHSTPESFFNYQLTRKDGFFYAQNVINELDQNKRIHFLELGRLDERDEKTDLLSTNEEGKKDDSYLQFLFRTPALRAALLTAILGVFLFLLFRTKRMQPQVDVIPGERNRSELFVQTIASIYRNRDNPVNVLHLHKKNFYHTIQKHFFVDLAKRTDHKEIEHLSIRCGVEGATISTLLNRLEEIDEKQINEDYLLAVSQLKRDFYLQTGIISDKIQLRMDEREFTIHRSLWLSFPLILTGISLVLYGLYLLVQSNGAGILLWPIGGLLLLWGIQRIVRPLLHINKIELTHYPLFGKRKQFKHTDILRAERIGSGFDVYYKIEKLHIPKSEMNNSDFALFELFLIKQKVIEF